MVSRSSDLIYGEITMCVFTAAFLGVSSTAAAVAVNVSLAASIASGIMQARSQQQQAKYQAAVDSNNALLAEYEAEDKLAQGEVDARTQQQKTAIQIGASRASAGGSGVDLDSGSALTQQLDIADQGAQDVSQIRQNARRSAYGLGVEASSLRASAKNRKTSGRNAAIGTILTTGASVAGSTASYLT